MSEKPQENYEDLLDQIMGRDPAYSGEPQEGTVEAPPEPESPPAPAEAPEAGQTPPPEKKNKRSSVYIYLLILFGAAFMMLLLAYFVQQRNNETTISDLRDSMTLSRQGLMDEIKALEEEKENLTAALNTADTAQKEAEQKLSEAEEQFEKNIQTIQEQFTTLMIRTSLQNILTYLEWFNHTGDWIVSASIVENCDGFLNEHNAGYDDQYQPYLLSSQAARYMELREELIENGRCMVIVRTGGPDENQYTEQIDIGEGIFEAADLDTARHLVSAILYYPGIPDISAAFISEYFQPDSSLLERLNAGAFLPSTVELLEEITRDLTDQGLLVVEEDGTLTAHSILLQTAEPENTADGFPNPDVSRETSDLPGYDPEGGQLNG